MRGGRRCRAAWCQRCRPALQRARGQGRREGKEEPKDNAETQRAPRGAENGTKKKRIKGLEVVLKTLLQASFCPDAIWLWTCTRNSRGRAIFSNTSCVPPVPLTTTVP